MKRIYAAAILSAAALSVNAHASVIACWNFNNYAGGNAPVAASEGSGSVLLSSWAGGLTTPAGTTVNAMPGDPAGSALGLTRGNPGNSSSSIFVSFSTSGYENLILTFATMRLGGNNQGFTSGTWAWSIDGVNFTNVAGSTHTNNNAWVTMTVDLSGIIALNDAANVTLRYTLSGATNNNGGAAIDNLMLTGNLIPAPGTIALLGIAALVGVRRRRSR